jgi:hypothetical protein
MDRQVFEEALARAGAEPDSFEANHEAARLAMEFGEPQRAASFLVRAYGLDPTRTDLLETLRGLLGAQEFERLAARLPPAPRAFWKDALLCLLFPFYPKILALVILCAILFFAAAFLFMAALLSPSLVMTAGFAALFLGAVGTYSFVLYRIIESTALYRGFTLSLVTDNWVEGFEFGVRLLLALAICFGPCFIAASYLPWPAVFYPLFLVGLVYFPMQLMCIFLCEQIREAIKPKNVWSLIRAAPGHYSVVVLFFALATLPGMIYDSIVQPPPELAFAILVPQASVTTFFLFVMARGLGILYLHHKRHYSIAAPEESSMTAQVVEPEPILPVAASPAPDVVKEHRAVSAENRAKFDEARASALQNSDDAEAQVLAGTLGLEAGERAEAVNFLARAYRLDPSKKFVYERLRSSCDTASFKQLRLAPPPGDFRKDLAAAFAYPWRGAVRVFIPGLIFFVLAGIAMQLVFELLVPVFWMILAGYSILTLMEITHVTAVGDEDNVTWAEFVDVAHCLAGFFKFVFAFLVAFFPAIGASFVFEEAPYLLPLAIFAGALYFPMAVLAVSFYNSVFAVLHPGLIVRSIVRIWRPYLLYLALCGGLTIITWGFLVLAFAVETDSYVLEKILSVVSSALFHGMWLYTSIVMFRGLGLLYRDHRHSLQGE